MAKQPKKSGRKEGRASKRGWYDDWVDWQKVWREQREKGKVVLKGDEIVLEEGKQGLHRPFVNPNNWDDVVAPGWLIFIMELATHSGKHKHQGGICLFVLEGKGHTVVDGVRYNWEKGDCIMLPLKPGGVEHQHFNDNPHGPSRWMCFDFVPLHVMAGMDETIQIELNPDWKGKVIFKEEKK